MTGAEDDQGRCEWCGRSEPNPVTRDIHEHECDQRPEAK